MGALFPRPGADIALYHACALRARKMGEAGTPSLGISRLVDAMMLRFAANRHASVLIVGTPEQIEPFTGLPKALAARPKPFGEVQAGIRTMLLGTVLDEAAAAVRTGAGGGIAPRGAVGAPVECSPSLRLLTAAVQEMIARASLCNLFKEPQNATLASVAEELIGGATNLLSDAANADALASPAVLSRLESTYIGRLLPWLVDSLSLFSAFAFDFAWRLLPVVLPLLSALKPLVATDDVSLIDDSTRNCDELSEADISLASRHPYNRAEMAERSKKRSSILREALTVTHDQDFPGASSLTLRFDPKCCTDEGDWLTLTFFRKGDVVQGRSLRLGGPWQRWPKEPVAVPADKISLEFTYRVRGHVACAQRARRSMPRTDRAAARHVPPPPSCAGAVAPAAAAVGLRVLRLLVEPRLCRHPRHRGAAAAATLARVPRVQVRLAPRQRRRPPPPSPLPSSRRLPARARTVRLASPCGSRHNNRARARAREGAPPLARVAAVRPRPAAPAARRPRAHASVLRHSGRGRRGERRIFVIVV